MSDAFPNFVALPLSLKLNHASSSTLTITNKETRPITFKIKTTTPSRYVVRPRMGAVHPNDSITINISHRPSSADPTTGSIVRDRFKVECVFLPQGVLTTEEEAITNLWASRPKPKEVEIHCEVNLSTANSGASAPSLSDVHDAPANPSAARATSGVKGGSTMVGDTSDTPNQADSTSQAGAPSSYMTSGSGTTMKATMSETKLREHIQQLEAELRAERTKAETALVAGRAREKELQVLRASQKKKKSIPLTVALPMMILVYLLSWYLNQHQPMSA